MKYRDISFGRHPQGVFYPADEELKKQSGDKYFVSYANDTKIRTFSRKDDAQRFVKKVNQRRKKA